MLFALGEGYKNEENGVGEPRCVYPILRKERTFSVLYPSSRRVISLLSGSCLLGKQKVEINNVGKTALCRERNIYIYIKESRKSEMDISQEFVNIVGSKCRVTPDKLKPQNMRKRVFRFYFIPIVTFMIASVV
jgi:hypothetical protein